MRIGKISIPKPIIAKATQTKPAPVLVITQDNVFVLEHRPSNKARFSMMG